MDIQDRELLLSQSKSKTLAEWAEFFGGKYTKRQISTFCHHNHIKYKKISDAELSKLQSERSRKYNINQDFFKTWSRDMAYVFGFWCADGCIYGGRLFDITIQKKDKYLLKQISQKLGYEGGLYDYVDRQACRINFSCVEIYNDIVALGGTERKSLTLDFPDVPDEFLSDFIRGYFDGDGCVMSVKGKRINTAITSGSRAFLESLVEKLRIHAGICGGSYDRSSMSYRFGNRDSVLLGQYMYKDSPELFLLRKRNKFPI